MSVVTPTLLPLDTWRKQLGFNPWHFWQFADQNIVPLDSACNGLVYKYSWQNSDAVGRQDILEKISDAETTLATQIALGFAPAPHFRVEQRPYPRYPDRTVDRLGYGQADWRWIGIQLNEGRIQRVGVEVRTLIGTANLTYADDDGDGLKENWSASIPTTVTDTDQIAVYFQATDRTDSEPVSEGWRIRPVRVVIAAGTATIYGKAWMMAKPELYETPSQAPLDPTVSANFVTAVEIYRYYCNPEGQTTTDAQIKLIWETQPHPYWCTCYGCTTPNTNRTDPAAEAYAIARATLRNAEGGLIGIGEASYDTTQALWFSIMNWSTCRPPDRIEARYQAGAALVNGEMDLQMQRIVTRFAAAELQRPICACNEANRELYKWQFDLSRTEGAAGEQYGATDQEDLNNPLGTCRGHAWAWKQIKYLRNLVGVAVG